MKILGMGDHVIDVYRNLQQAYLGGNALNVAVNAALLHQESAYLGVFGDDIYHTYILEFLKEKQIDISMCEHKKKASTKRCVEDVVDGERIFSHVEVKDNWAGVLQLSETHLAYLHRFDAIFTSCNAKVESQLSLLKDFKGILVYDFGEKAKYRCMEYQNQIFPYIDVAQYSMSDASQQEINYFVQQHPKDMAVLITRGSKPTLFYQSSICVSHAQSMTIPVDTMGAGDAYATALIISLLKQGWKKHAILTESIILNAMQAASAHAAVICGMHGGFDAPYQGLEAVIFDMDGVLVDSEVECRRLFREFLKEHGHTFRKEDEKRLYGCSDKDEDRLLCEYIKEEEVLVHERKEAFFKQNQFAYHDILMPGCKALIERLHALGVKLVIASSSPKKNIERMLEECELQPYFDFVVSGELFEESKPNPKIYEHCIAQLNVQRNHILVVEDSAYGIEAASRAKLHVIQFQQNMQPKHTDWIVGICESHDQIWDYIKQHYV